MNATPITPRNGLHYLWHLEQIGCITAREQDGRLRYSVARDWLSGEAQRPVRIALIDNGCAEGHPNLPAGQATDAPMEYAYNALGTVYGEHSGAGAYDDLLARLAAIGIDDLDHYAGHDISVTLSKAIHALTDPAIEAAPQRLAHVQNPANRFGPHGTACTGLMVARAQAEDVDDPNPAAMKYWGVNPGATVIPIATVYSPEYWPMVMALLYAVGQRADVIVIPRAIEEMENPVTYVETYGPRLRPDGRKGNRDPRFSEMLVNERRWHDKLLFEKLLNTVSESIPVVVAAGNTGQSQLEYPAKLVREEAPNLIVAGAVTSRGIRASYSSGRPPTYDRPTVTDVTCYAPGDDGQELSTDDVRFFDQAWRGRRIDMQAFDPEGFDGTAPHENPFSPYGVLAVDIPGPYGYDTLAISDIDLTETRLPEHLTAERTQPENLPRSLYAMFGGTSSACAITGGVVALMQMFSTDALTGPEAKALIEANLVEGKAVAQNGVVPDGPLGADGHIGRRMLNWPAIRAALT